MCFFFNDTATTEIYTLSLHDALPIYGGIGRVAAVLVHPATEGIAPVRPDLRAAHGKLRFRRVAARLPHGAWGRQVQATALDRKSTRLNSSHANISYAVFCLKNNQTNY